MNNLIFVVMHKNYSIPKFDPYKSISVGLNQEIIDTDYRDNSAENISKKNPMYCELTAQYWVWKNLENDYDNIGLNHYRRYFAISKFRCNTLLTNKAINQYLSKYDIILPKPWYWKINVGENYYVGGAGKKKDLRTTRTALELLSPSYVEDFDYILQRRYASYCNMFMTNKHNFNNYSEWLFKILNYVEAHTDLSNYTNDEKRIFGYLSEILLNVWVHHNNLNVKYLPMIEKEMSKSVKLKRNLKMFLVKTFNV